MQNELKVINDLVSAVKWVECEPTIDNLWESLKTIDPIFNLQFTMMLIESYFNFEENKGKSYRDLENEIRARNLNLGLIASRIEDDVSVKNVINSGEAFACKRKDFPNYMKDKEKFDHSKHSCQFTVLYSCRPREYVIQETLKHSRSMEENLEKLEESGFVITKDDKVDKNDTRVRPLSENEKSLAELIKEGNMKATIITINPKEEYERCVSMNPGCEPSLVAMGPNGEAIMGLVKDGKLLSKIGFEMGMYDFKTHQKYVKFKSIA